MKNIFSRRWGIITSIAILSSILFLVACVSQAPEPSLQAQAPERQTAEGVHASPSNPSISNNQTDPAGDVAPATSSRGLPGSSSGRFPDNVAMAEDTRTGISVTGNGKASGAPDLAVLSLGVETFAGSVAQARDQAAGAMDQVVQLLLASGIAEKDIQTRNFNISPRYTTREITRCLGANQTDCFKDRERVLIGYQVTNQLSVKLRALDSVGSLIDDITAAGGDLMRFQGVSFSIEDTQALEIGAREAAAADLMAKATQIANLTGVALGKPVFITEVSHSAPKALPLAMRDSMMGLQAAVETPILTGELDVVITLQALYAIQ